MVISREEPDRIMGREARRLGYTSVADAVRDAKTGRFQGKLPATKLLILDKLVHNHKAT